MPEACNDIDPRTLRRRRMTAAAILGLTLFVGSLPFLMLGGCFVVTMVQVTAERNRLMTDMDHLAVRDAARRDMYSRH